MKKEFLMIAFLLSCFYLKGQVFYGVKSGINIATTKDIIAFPKTRLGFHSGFFVSIPLKNKFFLQPELLYSSKGYSYNDLSDGKTISMRLNYLTLPLLAGYQINKQVSVLSGIEAGYLLKAVNYFNQQKNDVTNDFPQRFDLGLNVGVLFAITKSIGVDMRYSYGFKNLYQADDFGNPASEKKGANRVFQVGVNYRFKKINC